MKSDLPKWKVILNWICGVEMAETAADVAVPVKGLEVSLKTPQEKAEEAAGFLYEPEWKRNLVDANAVLVMAVAMLAAIRGW